MEKTLDKILAENLRRLKKAGKIESAKSLSDKAHIGSSTIGYMMGTKSRAETTVPSQNEKRAKRQPSCTLYSLQAVAAALEMHPLELITADDDRKGELLAAFDKVKPDDREKAVSVVLALAPKKTAALGTNSYTSGKKAQKKDGPDPAQPLAGNGDKPKPPYAW